MGGKSGSATIGYKYFFGLHMGICLGPVDSLVAITVGDKHAWPSAYTTKELRHYDAGSGTTATAGDGDAQLLINPDGSYTYNNSSDHSGGTQSGTVNSSDHGGWQGTPSDANGYDYYVTVNHPAPDPLTDNDTIYIQQPDLFGGDKKEGGISGKAEVYFGGPTQTVSAALKKMLGGGDLPEFRGVMSVYYDGEICALNPYPKTWKFRVRRALKGWDGDVWYSTKAKIAFGAGLGEDNVIGMNPAHMLYEIATNRDWGRGFPRTFLDDCAWRYAADTLFNEGFGLCMKWSRQEDINVFAQRILDCIGGVLYVDRGTGLFCLALIRDDYKKHDVDIPLFTYTSGLLAIEDDESAASAQLTNEVIVTYHDQIKDEDRQVRAQNLASVMAGNGVASASVDYTGVPSTTLALRLAQRDLKVRGTTLRRLKVTVDRRGWKIPPAGVFAISDVARGIDRMILRAGKIEDNTNGDSKIVITAVEDVFGLPATTYTAVAAPTYTAPNRGPGPVVNFNFFEASYRDLAHTLTPAELSAVDQFSGHFIVAASKPTPLSLNYTLMSAGGSEFLIERASGDFSPTAVLRQVAGQLDSEILLDSASWENIDPYMALPCAAILGNEIVRVDYIDPGNYRMVIGRGCVDTIPTGHAIGERIYIYDKGYGTDEREYVQGEEIGIRMLTKTSTGVLSPALAPRETLTVTSRQNRPYVPGNFRLNSISFLSSAYAIGEMNLTWTHRSRTAQGDTLVSHGMADIGPEPGVTYTVRIIDTNNGNVIREVAGITDNKWTYTNAMNDADGDVEYITVELFAMRGDVKSYSTYSFDLRHLPADAKGWGVTFGEQYGG